MLFALKTWRSPFSVFFFFLNCKTNGKEAHNEAMRDQNKGIQNLKVSCQITSPLSCYSGYDGHILKREGENIIG